MKKGFELLKRILFGKKVNVNELVPHVLVGKESEFGTDAPMKVIVAKRCTDATDIILESNLMCFDYIGIASDESYEACVELIQNYKHIQEVA